ncbi:MAG: UDP-N-acetylmuramate--L-alanine ligase [Candidatus Nealsonbacteria bacterium]|nr:MAG: UDP-N-acetylmuramate--L-alanine ligase [Candidatus Nealsonbacteria bacterium]
MKIHFIGIGGIGVSALAKYYLEKGCQVSGSDLVSSEITKALRKKGAKLLIGEHKAKNLPKNVDLVIYSPAIPKDNPELKEAKKLKIKCLSYPEALGELTKKYFTIAVSGTHGKSTTTAMAGLLLKKAGFDPTVIVGTKLKEFRNSNCRVGKSRYLVIEADEWQASFLNYWPKIIVLTNIEKEHLDYYKNLNNILKTYKEYIRHLPKDGVLIVGNEDDENTRRIIFNSQFPISNQFSIINYQASKSKDAQKLRKILKVPGEYNVSNALAALAVARVLKIPDKISFKALSEYRGSWRRFEIKKFKIPDSRFKILVISDYAHHPTEIKVTLEAAREKFTRKKIWCVFQPHQYQRTFYLFKDFVKAFSKAPIDKLIITDIYDVAGREKGKIKEKISSEKLIEAINKPWAIYLPKEEIVRYLKKNLKGREVVIIMGAGDIYKLVDSFT